MSIIENIHEDICLVKDIVPKDYQKHIVNQISGENNFPWYTINKIGHKQYFTSKENPYLDPNVSDFGGLYHMLLDENVQRSDYLELFMPILHSYCDLLEKDLQEIYRIRMRYTHPIPGHSKEKYAAPHVDFEGDLPFTTLIYYVDDSDGDTFFFSKFHNPGVDEYDPIIKERLTEVYRHTPTQGTAIFFNGHRYHAGNYPIAFGKRVVVNFDFIEK